MLVPDSSKEEVLVAVLAAAETGLAALAAILAVFSLIVAASTVFCRLKPLGGVA